MRSGPDLGRIVLGTAATIATWTRLLTLAGIMAIVLVAGPQQAANAAIAPEVTATATQQVGPASLMASLPLTTSTSAALTRAQRIEIVVRFALAQRGDGYCWSGSGPYCWDCSGLVKGAYARIGKWLPHYSGAMLRYGWKVSRANLRRGDVIWPHWGHVQLYLGRGYVVEASSSRDRIVVRRMWGFWTARRLI